MPLPCTAKSYRAVLQLLLLILMVAVLMPALVGEKLTVKLAEAPGAIGDAGVRLPTVNRVASAPLIVMLLIVRLVKPVFLIVNVLVAVLFAFTFPKSVWSVVAGIASPSAITMLLPVTWLAGPPIVTVIALLVTVSGTAQGALLVTVHVMASPVSSVLSV